MMNEVEVKYQRTEPQLLCRACLTIGRKLYPLGKYESVYRSIIPQLDLYNKLSSEEMHLCWECNALLHKAGQFIHRVQRANELLQLGENYILGSLSTLTTVVFNDYHPNTVYINKQDIEINAKVELNKNSDSDDNTLCFDEEIIYKEKQVILPVKSENNSTLNVDKTDKEKSVKTRNKTVNRWARKRALQNKKPKFKMYTNKDVNVLFRRVKIDCDELRTRLEKDKESKLYKSRQYKCETCVIGFKKQNSFLKHQQSHHRADIGPYSCDICCSFFKDKRHLSAHIKKHFYKYNCTVCQYSCYKSKHRRKHADFKHRKVFQCLKCEVKLSCRRDFYTHFKQWHEKFICDYCGISFKMRYCIKDHIRKQHSPFTCKPCNKTFARYNGLWLHNKTAHSVAHAPAYCVECDRRYPDVYRYRWHLANSRIHSRRKTKRVPCPGCDKVFSKNIYMKDHYNLVHLKYYKYRCEDCDKNFSRNADLVKHTRRVHEGILPPKNKICYVCGKGFSSNKILANHVRTHTGERPYACAQCAARFAQSAALAKHTRALHKTACDR